MYGFRTDKNTSCFQVVEVVGLCKEGKMSISVYWNSACALYSMEFVKICLTRCYIFEFFE